MINLPFKMPSGNLAQRMISALVLLPIVVLAVYNGGWFYDLFIISVALIAQFEWLSLTAIKSNPMVEAPAYIGLLLTLLTSLLGGAIWIAALMALSMVALFVFAYHFAPNPKLSFSYAAWVTVGFPYITLGALSLLLMREMPHLGLFAITYLLAVVWGTDIGGYVAGRLIGGPKIVPKISPKKTWAGFVGGVVLAAVSGFGVAFSYGDPHAFLAGSIALGLSIVSQFGDFFESHVKRRAGAKDSGMIIPGHGGVLDRIDGLLAASIAMGFLMVLKNFK